MAGGEGTRLRPLTSNQPKPMVPIVGKPCMEHIVELLKEHGFDDIVVTLAFMPQAIRGYFGAGESHGVSIRYSVEESPMGTAGSVKLAEDALDEPFLVISGDALCDIDLGAIVRFHEEKEALVTIALVSVDNPLEFGIVVTDEEGRIERFLEKPSWGQVFTDTINTGIYVVDPAVLKHVPEDRPFDFSKELFPLLLEMGRPLYGYVAEGYWQDIGNIDQFRQANFDALDERVGVNVPGIKLRGNVWVGEGVELADLESVEGPAFVGNYCRIAPQASVGPYSVLSPSVTLREHARTTRSVIDSSTYIGRSALIEGAIVGKSCDIKPHARLHEDVAVGDSCTIGEQSVVMPGVRIYPFKEVEAGSVVDRNLIWESRLASRLFGRDSVSGLINVDLTPETALRIGIALGTALKRGVRVVTSRDGAPACRLLKRAVVSGITSTGVNVADLHVMPAAVNRHFLKSEGLGAGIHVRPSTADPETLQIQFFEPPGIQATPELIKEIEKHFQRQEFRRAAHDEVGQIGTPARASETYAEDLLRTLDVEAIRARGFRIVIDYAHSAASLVLPLILGPLGVEAIAAHPYGGEQTPAHCGRSPRGDRAGEAPRRRGGSRLRRRLRPSGRAHLPRRRDQHARCQSSRSSSSSSAFSPRTGRAGRSRSRSPSRAWPSRSSRARSSRSPGPPRPFRRSRRPRPTTASSSRAPSVAASSSRSSYPPTTASRASASSCELLAPVERPLSELVARPARIRRSCTGRCAAPGPARAPSCASSPSA